MANVTIDVAAQFKGKAAFDKAGKSVGGLEKTMENLGKKLAAAFAVEKVIAFGKASVEAFAADEKSAALLNNTLKNLGLAFADPAMEQFIQKMTLASGVADDVLRPAMSKLLTTTGDYYKSQELLTQSLDISKGAGVDLATVTQDLANAYVGNTKGLKKYNLGLSAAELKAASFTDIQKKLNDQFKGANAAYLKTYAGKMDVLKNSASEAQETIGKGLVDSLMLISGDTSVQDLADSMQSLAQFTSDAIYGFGSLISKVKDLGAAAPPWLQNVFGKLSKAALMAAPGGNILDIVKKVASYGEKERNKTLTNPSVQMFMTDQNNQRLNNLAAKKAREDQAKLDKSRIKAQKENTAQLKAQAILKKGQGILDIQQIGLVAALKNNLSDQDRKSAELQLALLNGNDAAAAKLTEQILKSQDATGALTKFVNDLANTKLADPFTAWYKTLDDIQTKMDEIKRQNALNVVPNPGVSTNVPQNPITQMPSTVLAQASADFQAGQQTIKLMVEGGDEVTSLMRFKILESSMSGSQAQIDRTLGAFDR